MNSKSNKQHVYLFFILFLHLIPSILSSVFDAVTLVGRSHRTVD